MAKLNIEELVSGLLEAALVASSISERQHINALRNYFDDKGNPKTTNVKIGGKDVTVPLYILADHSSIGLDELDIEFEANLNFGENEASGLKKSLLGIFKKKGYDEHNAPQTHQPPRITQYVLLGVFVDIDREPAIDKIIILITCVDG